MRYLLSLLLLICLSTWSAAQAGIYKYDDKSKGKNERLELKGDGSFVYTQQQEWTQLKVTGTWKKSGSSKVLLNSKYQITDYTVEEIVDTTLKEGIHFVIQSYRKGQGFKKIKRILLNMDETLVFWPDGEAGLAEVDARQKLYQTATPQMIDSLKNTEPARFYHCAGAKDSVSTILIKYGEKELTYNAKNDQANKFRMVTKFATSPAYRYMTDEVYIFDKKTIQRAGGKGAKLKKSKK
ncbi:MAG: hypothetical protein GY810_13600 [Aureispira sp.]|nr:hypothetical protein [Aureispira sp.]